MATCDLLKFVVVGHVDHGKSTLIGRLLLETNSLPVGKIEFLKEKCATNNKKFEYAFLLDALREEQEKQITMDMTRVFFSTKTRAYKVIDAPGHKEYLKNMISGSAKADAAFLMVDASEGLKDNTRRHVALLSLIGFKKITVVLNKMDLLDYAEDKFNSLRSETKILLNQHGLSADAIIPVAAFSGENVARKSTNLSWYLGPTVFEHLESFQIDTKSNDLASVGIVQDSYDFADDLVVGEVQTGKFSVGDFVEFLPSGKSSQISTFKSFPIVEKRSCSQGEAFAIQLRDRIGIARGEVMVKMGHSELQLSKSIRAKIFSLEGMNLEKNFLLKMGTQTRTAKILNLTSLVDSLDVTRSKVISSAIPALHFAEVELQLDSPIVTDPSHQRLALNRFVLFDQGVAIAGGQL